MNAIAYNPTIAGDRERRIQEFLWNEKCLSAKRFFKTSQNYKAGDNGVKYAYCPECQRAMRRLKFPLEQYQDLYADWLYHCHDCKTYWIMER